MLPACWKALSIMWGCSQLVHMNNLHTGALVLYYKLPNICVEATRKRWPCSVYWKLKSALPCHPVVEIQFHWKKSKANFFFSRSVKILIFSDRPVTKINILKRSRAFTGSLSAVHCDINHIREQTALRSLADACEVMKLVWFLFVSSANLALEEKVCYLCLTVHAVRSNNRGSRVMVVRGQTINWRNRLSVTNPIWHQTRESL